jgi:hypothetical protein
MGQALLIFEAPIYGQQYVEVRCFRLFQKFTVLKPRETGVPSGLTLLP